ncbi:SEL1-like repeat protein [Sphingomonas sp. RS2018]
MVGTTLARIGLTTALVANATAGVAQTTPQITQPNTTIVVEGRRGPTAEAPRSAACEALMRDPVARQQLLASGGFNLFMQTRTPRNPDYSAPPQVPVGSPLPVLPKNRFGVVDPVFQNSPGTGVVESSDTIATGESALGGDPSGSNQTDLEAAVSGCRTLYAGGGGVNVPLPGDNGAANPLTRLNRNFAQARASIAANDTTLPMAFALFDQGRYAEALTWFRKAADKLPPRDGGDEATLFVGKLYLQGLGAQSDPAEGIKWLKKAAGLRFDPVLDMPIFDPRAPDRNTAIGEAAVILANVYRRGFSGVPRDMEQACRYYDRAADVGHVVAYKTLGDVYFRGDGVPRDVRKAVANYRKAAELDVPAAQVALADILSTGEDAVPADPKQAVAFYKAAARHNDGRALYMVARAYDDGKGVPADPTRALSLYKTAAIAGYPAAKVALGIYFHEGRQLPRDDATARKWFEAAAKDRDPDGMFNLAALQANGRGGPRDLPQAWVWLKRAAALGHTDAPAAVQRIEALMTPADRAAAAKGLSA